MGCDIHLWAEVRREGVWTLHPGPFVHHRSWVNTGGDGQAPVACFVNDEPYIGRNYVLFAILANVRGFAEHGFGPPRGVPADASMGYRAQVEKIGSDGFGHSWLTLKELTLFDWEAILGEYEDDEAWFRQNARVRATEGREAANARILRRNDSDMPRRAMSYAELAGDFYSQTLPLLEGLETHVVHMDDIRLVFFFDN